MSYVLNDFTIWLVSLWVRWKHRNDTPEQKQERLRTATVEVRKILADRPADKFVHKVYELLDEIDHSTAARRNTDEA